MKWKPHVWSLVCAIFPWLCEHYEIKGGTRDQLAASRREREQFALRLAEVKLKAVREGARHEHDG